ncbi:MAG: hypothetical protein QOH71_1509 [Blastocatellia bacterium]|nr:hypothetical protein [Blastocatellia bacterium]
MKFADIIAVIVAALGLGAALEGYLSVEFSTKLIVLALCAVIVFFVVTRRLTNWVKARAPTGPTVSRPRRSRLKLFLAVIGLTLVAVGVFAGAYAVMTIYALNVEVVQLGDEGGVWLNASRPVATKVALSVPKSSDGFDCRPVSSGDRPSQTTMLEWDGLNPHLQITNFRYPERQGVICRPAAGVDKFQRVVEPATLEVLLPAQHSKYQRLFIYLGGALWIASLLWLFVRSR